MSIWNKVLVLLICLVAPAFFYFSARALSTHKHWRESAQKHDQRIAALETEADVLLNGKKGDESQPGLRKTQLALYEALIGRGRVWYNCMPKKIDPKTFEIAVSTDVPAPHGITDKTVLTVFDEQDFAAGGRYLGQFVVRQVDEKNKQVVFAPVTNLDPAALQRIAKSVESKKPWTLCEIMPSDNHDIFAGMKPEQLAKMLPQASLDEYAKDGQDKYVRQLRDYQFLFDNLDSQHKTLIEARNAALLNKNLMDEAVADAKKQVQFRQEEIASLRKEVAEVSRERDVILAHQKSLESEIQTRVARIDTLIKQNRSLAAEIAKDQLEAVRRVDVRTASLK